MDGEGSANPGPMDLPMDVDGETPLTDPQDLPKTKMEPDGEAPANQDPLDLPKFKVEAEVEATAAASPSQLDLPMEADGEGPANLGPLDLPKIRMEADGEGPTNSGPLDLPKIEINVDSEAYRDPLDLPKIKIEQDGEGPANPGSLDLPEIEIEVDTEVDPSTDPLDLPSVVTDKIFSFFEHYDKLGARLICRRWNKHISGPLPQKSFFYLSSEKSYETLIDSSVDWTQIDRDYDEIQLPQRFEKLITTVKMRFCGLSGWKNCMAFLIKLPALNKLVLEMSPSSAKEGKVEEDLELSKNFKKIVGQLEELSITFVYVGHMPINKFLKTFETDSMKLRHLRITEDQADEDETKDAVVVRHTLKQIFEIISKSSASLIFLNLDFLPKSLLSKNLIPKLIKRLCTLRDLKLKSALIWIHTIDDLDEESFSTHRDFLIKQTHGNSRIKEMSLPWRSDYYQCQKFLRNLPIDLQFIGNMRKEHNLTPEFWTKFTKLESMSITSKREKSVFSEPWPTILTLDVNLKEFVEVDNEDMNFYEIVGKSLVNLVNLYIHGYHEEHDKMTPFQDHDLRLIIKNFKQLRDLRIARCPELTDSGITGIDGEYMAEIFKTREFYKCPVIPEEYQIGLPLSSLEFLEKLELCTYGQLSDLGIYYGLQFGSTLKEMTIHASKVTAWGLDYLGKGNPGLETFDGYFVSEEPLDGNLLLKKHFPLIESSGQFRYKNVLEN